MEHSIRIPIQQLGERLRLEWGELVKWDGIKIGKEMGTFKTIVARDLIFTSKCIKTRLAAGLRPDQLGEVKRSPVILASAAEAPECCFAEGGPKVVTSECFLPTVFNHKLHLNTQNSAKKSIHH